MVTEAWEIMQLASFLKNGVFPFFIHCIGCIQWKWWKMGTPLKTASGPGVFLSTHFFLFIDAYAERFIMLQTRITTSTQVLLLKKGETNIIVLSSCATIQRTVAATCCSMFDKCSNVSQLSSGCADDMFNMKTFTDLCALLFASFLLSLKTVDSEVCWHLIETRICNHQTVRLVVAFRLWNDTRVTNDEVHASKWPVGETHSSTTVQDLIKSHFSDNNRMS